jgi:molecular chaperone DnaK (HSP70)
LQVLGSAFDLSVGGLAFDIILREHFRTMFINQFKIDAATNARAWLRLLDECEKVKKQMSANSTTIPLNIECFMDGKDVSGKIQRFVSIF